jgi:fructokinase
MVDILALGELLIDFSPAGINGQGIALYARNPGGAPANVLAMATKLGADTALITKVGNDSFGEYLRDVLLESGVGVRGLVQDAVVPTTLAFVHISPSGERSFSFYRNPGADSRLKIGEVDQEQLRQCRIFHFGSVSLTDNPTRETTLWAAETAKKAGAVVSFDPNYRPLLWRDEAAAEKQILSALRLADIVKISDEELQLSTGYSDPENGAKAVLDTGASAVVISLGAGGSYVRTRKAQVHADAFPVHAVDTTGAGDAFWGTVLYALKERSIQEIRELDAESWMRILRFANAAGALTATASGAIPAMPALDKILRLTETPPAVKPY